jgi:hypothetical protein
MLIGSVEIDPVKWEAARHMAELASLASPQASFTKQVYRKGYLHRILKSVITDCHITQTVDVVGDFQYYPFDVSSGSSPLDHDRVAIVINPLVAEFIEKRFLAAVFAHELGHIAANDSGFRRSLGDRLDAKYKIWDWNTLPDAEAAKLKPRFQAQEFAADAFASAHGYGKDLAEWFERSSSEESIPLDLDSTTHPALRERIRRLREGEK